MNANEKWNYIVDQYHRLFDRREAIIQKAWEDYFSELFGYRKFLGEIESQRSITIGASERTIPDIILKKDEKDLFVVELKQYSLSYVEKMEDQLVSYLKQLRLPFGLLICKEIYLCHFLYEENIKRVWCIPFKKDNPDGIKLMDLLDKEGFSKDRIMAFVDERLKEKEDVDKIKSEIAADFVEEIVKDYYERQHYAKETIEEALKEFDFRVERKISNPDAPKAVRSVGFKGEGIDASVAMDLSADIDFPASPRFMIIKTKQERVNLLKARYLYSDKDALYHATRHAWNVSYDKVMRYNYVLSVIDKYVQEVYFVKTWKLVSRENENYWGDDVDDEKALGRYEFIGEVAPEEIRTQWIGKEIPYRFRKRGMASPTLYSDQKGEE